MGMFGKLAFWKKKDEPLDYPMGMPEGELGKIEGAMPMHPTGLPEMQFSEQKYKLETAEEEAPPPVGIYPGLETVPQRHQPSQPSESREIQIIAAKMDTLKATLDNIGMRLERIEKILESELKRRW